MKKKVTFFSILILGLFSCRKEKIDSPQFTIEQPHGYNDAIGLNMISEIPTYPLDWENINFMPTPDRTPSVLVPWASGASRQFPQQIAHDYKSKDGWELVYNTFNTATMHDKRYFILHNIYRGLLRIYYYLPNTTNLVASSNITYKLGVGGTYAKLSPIMNFEGAEIVDFNDNVKHISKVEPWQIAPSTWYAFEYELAYDSNLNTQNSGIFNFIWPITPNQITQINIPTDNSLGVFYIANKPIIEEAIHIIPQKDISGNYVVPQKKYIYSPVNSSLNLIFSPSVLSVATIQNIRYETILNYSDMYEMKGGVEFIGDNKCVFGSFVGTINHPGSVVGIRVTFDVIPRNGSPKSVITKIFRSDIITKEINSPEGEGHW